MIKADSVVDPTLCSGQKMMVHVSSINWITNKRADDWAISSKLLWLLLREWDRLTNRAALMEDGNGWYDEQISSHLMNAELVAYRWWTFLSVFAPISDLILFCLGVQNTTGYVSWLVWRRMCVTDVLSLFAKVAAFIVWFICCAEGKRPLGTSKIAHSCYSL